MSQSTHWLNEALDTIYVIKQFENLLEEEGPDSYQYVLYLKAVESLFKSLQRELDKAQDRIADASHEHWEKMRAAGFYPEGSTSSNTKFIVKDRCGSAEPTTIGELIRMQKVALSE